MKSYRQELWFKTPERRAFINITAEVDAALHASSHTMVSAISFRR
jgi:thiamine phosphate synthase YjbQ (UPF0047 family)